MYADIKPRAVREDSGTPSGNGTKSNEESVDQVTTMLATVWFGAQSGW